MSNNYTIVIEKVGDYTDTIVDCEEMGYIAYELPNNVVLMVHRNAPEDIVASAVKAQDGDHNADLSAIRDTTTWQYKIESVKNVPSKSTKLNELQQVCDNNGKEGWELVNTTYNEGLSEYTLFFKKGIE
jgi:hypothetical protein